MDIIFGGFMLFGFTVRELACPSPDLTKKTHTRQQGCSSSQLQATGVDYTMYEKFPNQCNQKAELFSVYLEVVFWPCYSNPMVTESFHIQNISRFHIWKVTKCCVSGDCISRNCKSGGSCIIRRKISEAHKNLKLPVLNSACVIENTSKRGWPILNDVRFCLLNLH